MDVVIGCPGCGARYRVPAPAGAEKRFKCRKCGGVMTAKAAALSPSGAASKSSGKPAAVHGMTGAGSRRDESASLPPPPGKAASAVSAAKPSEPAPADAAIWSEALGSLADMESKASSAPATHVPEAAPASRSRAAAAAEKPLPLPGTSRAYLRPVQHKSSDRSAAKRMSGPMLAWTISFHVVMLLILLVATGVFVWVMFGGARSAEGTLFGGAGIGVVGLIVSLAGGIWLLVQAFMRDLRLGAAMVAVPIGVLGIAWLGAAKAIGPPVWPIISLTGLHLAPVIATILIARVRPSGGHVYLVGMVLVIMSWATLTWGSRDLSPESGVTAQTFSSAMSGGGQAAGATGGGTTPTLPPEVLAEFEASWSEEYGYGKLPAPGQRILGNDPRNLAIQYPPPYPLSTNNFVDNIDEQGRFLQQQIGYSDGKRRCIEGVEIDSHFYYYEVLPGTPKKDTRTGQAKIRKLAGIKPPAPKSAVSTPPAPKPSHTPQITPPAVIDRLLPSEKQDILKTSPEVLSTKFPPPELVRMNELRSVKDVEGNTIVQQAGPDSSGRYRRLEGVIRPDGTRIGYEVVPGTPTEQTRYGREEKRLEAEKAAESARRPSTPEPASVVTPAPIPAPVVPELSPEQAYRRALSEAGAANAPDRYFGEVIAPVRREITPALIEVLNGLKGAWTLDARVVVPPYEKSFDLLSGLKKPDGLILASPQVPTMEPPPLSVIRPFRRVSLIGFPAAPTVEELCKTPQLEELVWRGVPLSDGDQARLAKIKTLKRVVIAIPGDLPPYEVAVLKSKRTDISIEMGKSSPLRRDGPGFGPPIGPMR